MRSASCSLRLAEDGGREAADAVGVADTVDFDDFVVDNGEGQDGERPPVEGNHRSDRAVDQSGVQLGTAWGAGQLDHGRHAADDDWRPGGAEVGAQYDVGIEDSDVAISLQARGNL